jgi:ectoine hydroxylase-related dioxygenase (phytanoyl-CoA dioxygenase family)
MLSDAELAQFATDGYLHLRGVVAEPLLAAVDAEIDGVVAEKPPPPEAVASHRYYKRPERVPAAAGLFRASPLLALTGQLVAPHEVDLAFAHIQIVLNIPPNPRRAPVPHVDGHLPHQEKPDTFTILAGVFLGDETELGRGNVWVWPGSHHQHARVYAREGVRALLPHGGQAALLDPPETYGEPVPILAQRGDVLLAHYLLGHATGANTTDRVRRIVYHRLVAVGHEQRWAETLTDVFAEFAPLRRFAPDVGEGA